MAEFAQDFKSIKGEVESRTDDLARLKESFDKKDAKFTLDQVDEMRSDIELIEQDLLDLSKEIQIRINLMTEPEDEAHRKALQGLLTAVDGLINTDLKSVRELIDIPFEYIISPDSKQIWNDTDRKWHVLPENFTPAAPVFAISEHVLSPDGKNAWIPGRGQQLGHWEVATATSAPETMGPDTTIEFVFSPDGEQVWNNTSKQWVNIPEAWTPGPPTEAITDRVYSPEGTAYWQPGTNGEHGRWRSITQPPEPMAPETPAPGFAPETMRPQ